MKFTKWLFTFLTEKGIYQDENSDLLFGESTDFLPEQQDAQDKNFIQLDFFLEFMEQLPAGIQNSIKTNFVKLDFHNADCRDYLKHLINGMFKAQGHEPVYVVKHA
jgi:hypothetical protein